MLGKLDNCRIQLGRENVDTDSMKESLLTPHVLDSLVPWVAFIYGSIMIFVFQNQTLVKLAETRIPEPHRSRFLSNIRLGWVSFVVGGVWIIQNLWA